MKLVSDIRHILTASRSLLHYCDQWPATGLRRLNQPLPPMFYDNSTPAVQELVDLMQFNPADVIAESIPGARVPESHTTPVSKPLFRKDKRESAINVTGKPPTALASPGNQLVDSYKGLMHKGLTPAPEHSKNNKPVYESSDKQHAGRLRANAVKKDRVDKMPTHTGDRPDYKSGHVAVEGSAPKTGKTKAGHSAKTGTTIAPRSKPATLAEKRKLQARMRGKANSAPGHAPYESRTLSAKMTKPANTHQSSATGAARNQYQQYTNALAGKDSPSAYDIKTDGKADSPRKKTKRPAESGKNFRQENPGQSSPEQQNHRIESAQIVAPGRPANYFSLPEDSLAQQLADAAYRHGVDVT